MSYKLSLKQALIPTALLCVVLIPFIAQAGVYTFVETLPGSGMSGSMSRTGLFSSYLQAVYRIALTTAAILAMLFLIIGGVRYVLTAISPSDKQAAKTIIWNAIGGLLIVLAGWLILYTINPDFVNFNLVIPGVTGGAPPSAGGQRPGVPGTGPGTGPNDTTELNSICGTGVQVAYNRCNDPNVSSCAPGQTTGCVSLNGLPQSTTANLGNLQNACAGSDPNCQVTVTGGTEGGHQTHGPGNAVVDLRKNTELNTYITSNATSVDNSGTYPIYTMPDGGRYMDEGNHWHVDYR